MGSRIANEEVVEPLMKCEGHECREVHNKKSSTTIKNVFLGYLCPNLNCRARTITFLDKLGFNNSYRQLQTFYARERISHEQESVILIVYPGTKLKSNMQGRSILADFNVQSLHSLDLWDCLSVAIYWYLRCMTTNSENFLASLCMFLIIPRFVLYLSEYVLSKSE